MLRAINLNFTNKIISLTNFNKMKKNLTVFLFLFIYLSFLSGQGIDKIFENGFLKYQVSLDSNIFFLSIDSSSNNNNRRFYLPIDDKDNTIPYYKWAIKDSALIILFNDVYPDGNSLMGRIKRMVKNASSDSFEIRRRFFTSDSPYSILFMLYRYKEPDSAGYIKYDVSIAANDDLLLGVVHPGHKMLSIWKFLNDTTYERSPYKLSLYGNHLNWSFVDSIRLDSIEDFCMMKTPGGFLLSFTDGQSFILQNGNKTDHRTLPKSAKFLFIQEENRCTIKSVDANGNTVASTVYTW